MNKGIHEFKRWICISNYAFKTTFIYSNKRCHILLNHYITSSVFYFILRISCKTLIVLNLSITAPVISSTTTGSSDLKRIIYRAFSSGKPTLCDFLTVTTEIYAH
jgi:hypothetical protein